MSHVILRINHFVRRCSLYIFSCKLLTIFYVVNKPSVIDNPTQFSADVVVSDAIVKTRREFFQDFSHCLSI
jgi:hypothetical protein